MLEGLVWSVPLTGRWVAGAPSWSGTELLVGAPAGLVRDAGPPGEYFDRPSPAGMCQTSQTMTVGVGLSDTSNEPEATARVLLVEDDVAIADSLAYSFRAAGYAIDVVGSGEGALQVKLDTYDLIVLDVMLPELSSAEVCRRVRERSAVPILMLTARSDEVDRVVGLEVGAGDYLGKPFAMAELLSRVRAILRRRQLDLAAGPSAIRQIGTLRLDLAEQTVQLDGRPIEVTPSEFRARDARGRAWARVHQGGDRESSRSRALRGR
ncbi:MAG: response regulator transcription factor [Pseudonocardia sp.]|nr:response regulator transcription factor [Pseudonocardia sp.]